MFLNDWNSISKRVTKRVHLAYDLITDKRLNIDTYVPMPREVIDPDAPVARYRILCFFASGAVKKCVGVELLAPLAATARCNLMRLKSREAPAEVITGDAVAQDYDDATHCDVQSIFCRCHAPFS